MPHLGLPLPPSLPPSFHMRRVAHLFFVLSLPRIIRHPNCTPLGCGNIFIPLFSIPSFPSSLSISLRLEVLQLDKATEKQLKAKTLACKRLRREGWLGKGVFIKSSEGLRGRGLLAWGGNIQ
jgi:hypothetical protein